MKRIGVPNDSRVKRRVFPVSTFIAAWAVVALLATMQLQALSRYFDYKHLPALGTPSCGELSALPVF